MLIPRTQFDDELASRGLNRKHVPFEPNSLFRCVAEMIYFKQNDHETVRKECVDHLRLQAAGAFGTNAELLKRRADALEEESTPGTVDELSILSLIYSREFLLYKEGADVTLPLMISADDGNHSGTISLSFSGGFFAILYTDEEVKTRAVMQAIVYETLYINEFGYTKEELDEILMKMLNDKYYAKLKLKRKRRGSYGVVNESADLKELPPIPYKVAKALDPNQYRNVELDLWLDENKEKVLTERKQTYFKEGSHCLVPTLDGKFHGVVKELLEDSLVRVYLFSKRSDVVCAVVDLEKTKHRGRNSNHEFSTKDASPYVASVEKHAAPVPQFPVHGSVPQPLLPSPPGYPFEPPMEQHIMSPQWAPFPPMMIPGSPLSPGAFYDPYGSPLQKADGFYWPVAPQPEFHAPLAFGPMGEPIFYDRFPCFLPPPIFYPGYPTYNGALPNFNCFAPPLPLPLPVHSKIRSIS